MKNRKPAVRPRSSRFQPWRSVSVTASSMSTYHSPNAFSNTSLYKACFDSKWYSRLGRRMPTASAISFSEVPS